MSRIFYILMISSFFYDTAGFARGMRQLIFTNFILKNEMKIALNAQRTNWKSLKLSS
jgi:hypothetical protein